MQIGSSVWFGPTTPIGVKYGSSQNQPYLNLRPLADTATTPSTTTYTFDQPDPADRLDVRPGRHRRRPGAGRTPRTPTVSR